MAGKAREAFRTISEVADWLDVPAHVLRFWESKFSQIKPVKRAGGRRYYRPDDMELIGGIKKLLHDDGMTIRGVQKMLKEDGVKTVAALSPSLENVDDAATPRTQRRKAETPDVEEAEIADATTDSDDTPAGDREAIAAWSADAEEDTPTVQPERPPLVIETAETEEADATEPTEVEEDVEEVVAEAPFIHVPEDTARGGDNVVELAAHSDPVTEPEPEAEPEAEPVVAKEPEPEPERPSVKLDPNREKTLPPPPSKPEPAVEVPETAEGFQLSESQKAMLALRRKLRSTDPSHLKAEPALAAQVARLQSLRDRLAVDLSSA